MHGMKSQVEKDNSPICNGTSSVRARRLLDGVQGELGPLPELGGPGGHGGMARPPPGWDAGSAAAPAPLLHARFVVAPEHADAMPPIPAVMPGVDLPALLPLRGMSTAGAARTCAQHGSTCVTACPAYWTSLRSRQQARPCMGPGMRAIRGL